MSPTPKGNDKSIRQDTHFGKLFDATPLPDRVDGFEPKDKDKMKECWPEGLDKAKEVSIFGAVCSELTE